jgi:molybdopterin-containing oxidoreductase family iron-sulfur binding subunit
MAIDVAKCIGCRACSVACKSNNNLPDGIWYNRVETNLGNEADIASGSYPDGLSLEFTPISCQHCGRPLCVAACSFDATWRDDETGIVVIDNELCQGCQSCIAACPYGARSFNDGEPAYQVDFPLGDADAPSHRAMTTEKCTFCYNRIQRGEVPACMELCLARARFWGDLDDPDSEISKYIVGKDAFYLFEDEGTGPSTVYVR